jgi:hypothetical protein
MHEIVQYLKQILGEQELSALNNANSITNSESRILALKDFFHKPEIFNRINETTDPSRLAFDVHVKCKGYEF